MKDIEDKIPDITNLATTAALNAKINDVKGEIPNSGLATTAALAAVENKTPDVNTFVKKADYAAKLSELKKNILPLQVIMNLGTIYLIQR